jgi:hypothetical protein
VRGLFALCIRHFHRFIETFKKVLLALSFRDTEEMLRKVFFLYPLNGKR